jgi:hypothetical protein
MPTANQEAMMRRMMVVLMLMLKLMLLYFDQVVPLWRCSPACYFVRHAIFSYETKTPLQWAVDNNHTSVADFLRQHGGK